MKLVENQAVILVEWDNGGEVVPQQAATVLAVENEVVTCQVWPDGPGDDGLRECGVEQVLCAAVCDDRRHLVAEPYSLENCDLIADAIGVKRCWRHGDHYDLPARRVDEMTARCRVVRPREVLEIIGRGKR